MMSIRLVLEHAPTPQSQTEMVLMGRQMIVGRGQDADWCIDDPDRYISRKHFVLHMDGDVLSVTDASSGGLFIDGASTALGTGNTAEVDHGTRLRFGEFVAKVELVQAKSETAPPPEAEPANKGPFEFDFSPPEDPPSEPAPRPENLPDPFGLRSAEPAKGARAPNGHDPEPLDLDDPFALDLNPGARSQPKPTSRNPYFGRATPPPQNPVQEPELDPSSPPFGSLFATPPAAETAQIEPTPPEPTLEPAGKPPLRAQPSETVPAPRPAEAHDLRAAFLRGAGLSPSDVDDAAPVAQMEQLGAHFRAMTEGLVTLLRVRAETKSQARVATTTIGAHNVNKLKFVATTDEAIAALLSGPQQGYLDPDTALEEAHRDLVDHQLRSWSAMQDALRRMIDKFDPTAIEEELSALGLLDTLIAGGRNAKLWQLYEERYKEIAKSAEERFLGEIGADFRDAYEENDRR